MRSILPIIVCAFAFCVSVVSAQSPTIEPVRAAAGSVLTFYLQTRLNPSAGNAVDALPKGTVLRVRIFDSIDSSVDRDGAGFRGALVSAVTASDKAVVLHPDAEVRGLLALLRSRSHPEGFRYELLVTSVTENGKSYAVTASLNPSFFDDSKPHAQTVNLAGGEKAAAVGSTKLADELRK
jgi:hypothetical protein